MFFKTYTDISGTILNVKTTKIDDERYNEIVRFEGKSELIIPGWLPPGMDLTEILDSDTNIVLNYKSNNEWLIFHQNLTDENEAFFQTDNNKFDIEDTKILDTNGKIVRLTNENGLDAYTVFWTSKNILYKISTNVNKNTLDAILSSLKYLNN